MKSKFAGIGERIISQLTRMNKKQSDLARATGISANAISQYVTGRRVPDTASLYTISSVLKTSMEWLLTGIEDTTDENMVAENSTESALLLLFRQLDERDKNDVFSIVEIKAHRSHLGNTLASSTSSSGKSNTADEMVG